MSAPAPADALLPALGRLDALLRAVAEGTPGAATIAAGDGDEPASRLTQLGDALGLEPFDLDVLLLAMAPELERGYGPLFAALQQEPLAWRPTVDVILQVLCLSEPERLDRRLRFGPRAPLVELELIRLTPLIVPGGPEAFLVAPDPRIVDHLLGEEGIDPRLEPVCRLLRPADASPADADVGLAACLGPGGVLALEGARDAGAAETAHALAARMDSPLLVLELGRAVARGLDVGHTTRLAVREAALAGAFLFLASDGELPAATLEDLPALLRPFHGPVLISAPDARPLENVDGLDVLVVPLAAPGREGRERLWRWALGEVPGDADLAALASRFRLGGEAIMRASHAARARARVRAAGGGDGRLTSDDLFAAARRSCGSELEPLTRKIESVFGWDDIVLPDDSIAQLREICVRVERRDQVIDGWGFRRTLGIGVGVSALFAGSSGTGKTMAAGVLANELQLDLHAIQLASIVSKYIGETSKNLDKIFRAAQDANAILFFDEADALFGKRSEVRDSHDRYANVEIAYLLQKMEAYDGVAILATNLRQNLDEAFARRLAFTLHFPFPGAEDRLKIWRRVWPDEVPLAGDVDLRDLAERFRLSGGNIRNAALAAAFLAAAEDGEVRREHLLRAIRREYQKLGRGLSEAELNGVVEPEPEEALA